ncbi:Uncharacterised protein [Vibrio cholerae]|nr:Uncharacterised protein [Vibrio cholerae]
MDIQTWTFILVGITFALYNGLDGRLCAACTLPCSLPT